MGWRDGCLERPTVSPGATPVRFDFAEADAVGGELERVRSTMGSNLSARAGAIPSLLSWLGSYRSQYDGHRQTQEAVLSDPGVADAIAALRRAWDTAATAQASENRRADAAAAEAGRPTPPSRVPR